MVVFWIFTAIVYSIVGVIILQWMNDILDTRNIETFDNWLAIGIALLWPVVMYVLTVLTVFYGIWSLGKKAWEKIKSWFKIDKDVKDNCEDDVNETDLNTDFKVDSSVLESSTNVTTEDSSSGL